MKDRLAIYQRLPAWTSDWHWFRRKLLRLSPPPKHEFEALLPPWTRSGSRGTSYPLRREFGGWAIRPSRGWRQFRWITPPLHYTRGIPADNEDVACDWALERMGL